MATKAMPETEKKTRHTGFNMTERDYKRLHRTARARNTSASDMMRQLVMNEVDRHERNARKLKARS